MCGGSLETASIARTPQTLDPEFINIGDQELIDMRASRTVPIAPGGTLADYIPFYFTPLSR